MYAEKGVLDARFVDALVNEFMRLVSEGGWQAVKVEGSINLYLPWPVLIGEEAYE